MNKGIIGLFSLIFAVSAVAAVVEKTESYRKIRMENQFLILEFLPESLGRMDQIIFKSTGKKLLIERSLTKVSVDPLYEFYRNNSFGCGENFWKNYVASRDGKSRVTAPDKAHISFENFWYGGLAVNVSRRSELLENETLITFEAEVFNRDEKKSFFLAPWYSLVPDKLENTTLLIPVKGGLKSHALGNVKAFEKDMISQNPKGLLAACRNWVATVYPEEKLVLAVIIPPEEFFPDGAFYSWHGQDGSRNYRSMEVILHGSNLAPGKRRLFRCHFAVFAGMPGIKDIAGTTAVDAAFQGESLILTFAPARKVAGGKMQLKWQCEQKSGTAEVVLPELLPGRSYEFTVNTGGRQLNTLSGSLPDGSEFTLSAIK